MYVPLLEEYLDSLYDDSTYIVPGFIYKRVHGIIFINQFKHITEYYVPYMLF